MHITFKKHVMLSNSETSSLTFTDIFANSNFQFHQKKSFRKAEMLVKIR